MIAGCGSRGGAGSGPGDLDEPAFTAPAQTPSPSPTTAAAADTTAVVRGSVTFALATKDGYKGTVMLTAYKPAAFSAHHDFATLAECTPSANPTRTALVRVDFMFRDQSPPEFPWKLGWGVDAFGSGRVFATRPGPQEPFACYQAASWSGAGTMSLLVAMEDYFSPKSPKGSPERLKDTGAAFPLLGGVSSDEITIASSTGDVRGGASAYFSPALQIAFRAKG
ncbi:hypothetical protein ACFP2T_18475 [Plantactinospora solaniradicis]|uniref:DUF3455 domain-containing protein n=1 Tax=Plantactinospora solaniradicis TaxID=1723736 RepID=A0ABW1K8R0_9ACTN